MSRLDRALARLRAGDAILLIDEVQQAVAHVLLVAPGAPGPSKALLVDACHGPLMAVTRVAPSTDDGVVDGELRALGLSTVVPRRGGVLAHPGAIEAAADLLTAAAIDRPALMRAAVLPGGVLARAREALRLAQHHGLAVVSIQDVVAHRLATETIVEDVATAQMPTVYAGEPLEVRAFRNLIDGLEHLALIRRPESGFGPEPLVRLHSECLTGDALGSLRCDCGQQLRRALREIGDDRQGGVLIYLRGQEGRGIGLANKIKAYALQEQGLDTVDANTELGFPADLRDYGVAIQMLGLLGIGRLRLLANNPAKRDALERYGIVVSERRSLRIGPNPHNASYLDTKRLRMGHDLAPGLRVVSDV